MADITNPEMIGLERQRAIAKALLNRGMETPQGQMVSGRYVGASPLQYIGNLFNQYAGQKGLEEADVQQQALAEALKNKENVNLQTGLNQLYGTPEFVQQGPTPTGGNIPIQPATKPDRRLALATLLAPEGGAVSKSIAAKLAELEFAEPKMHNVSPGGALVGPDGKVIYQAPYRPLAGEGGVSSMEGRFNKKGDFIAPGGIFIGKSEVAKDREIARSANELRQGLQQLSPEDIKNTETVLGDVTQNGFKKYIASQFGNPALKAQAKVNASAVMQTLQNLPPGPASDKDIMQAKSSFPGYGDAQALQEWVNNTNAMLERKITNVNAKYGSEDWYGAQGISNKPTTPNFNQQDQEALDWANKNSSDPRAKAIKKRLGVQ
jgi:hypothetical protein